MKKNYFLVIPFIILSCRNEDNNSSTNDGIIGTWKKNKEIIYSGKDNSIIATYPNDDPCEKNSTTEFANDGKVYFRQYYKNTSNNCVQHPTETKTYSFDTNTKKLNIEGKLYGEIIKSTNSELETKVSLGDENNDGVKDYAVEYGYK